jgi:hypothetical protein
MKHKFDLIHVDHRNLLPTPDVANFDGVELFGEGNVGAAFRAFPTQHLCNKYCKWFHLEPVESADGSD